MGEVSFKLELYEIYNAKINITSKKRQWMIRKKNEESLSWCEYATDQIPRQVFLLPLPDLVHSFKRAFSDSLDSSTGGKVDWNYPDICRETNPRKQKNSDRFGMFDDNVLKLKKKTEKRWDSNQRRIPVFFWSPLMSSCVTSNPCNPTSLFSTRGSSPLVLNPRWELQGRLFSWLRDVFPGCSTPSHLTAFLLKFGGFHGDKSTIVPVS